MEYTKGEWKLTADKRQVWAGQTMVAAIGNEGYSMPPDWAVANAHLIATSPQMYQALKALLKWWHHTYDSFYPDEFELASKAIAKAEGHKVE